MALNLTQVPSCIGSTSEQHTIDTLMVFHHDLSSNARLPSGIEKKYENLVFEMTTISYQQAYHNEVL